MKHFYSQSNSKGSVLLYWYANSLKGHAHPKGENVDRGWGYSIVIDHLSSRDTLDLTPLTRKQQ